MFDSGIFFKTLTIYGSSNFGNLYVPLYMCSQVLTFIPYFAVHQRIWLTLTLKGVNVFGSFVLRATSAVY